MTTIAAIAILIPATAVRQGQTRPVVDLCIAATALVHGCTLVTLNTADFAGIPGLSVEEW